MKRIRYYSGHIQIVAIPIDHPKAVLLLIAFRILLLGLLHEKI